MNNTLNNQLPFPQGWISEWDNNRNCPIYVDTRTNLRTYDDPRLVSNPAPVYAPRPNPPGQTNQSAAAAFQSPQWNASLPYSPSAPPMPPQPVANQYQSQNQNVQASSQYVSPHYSGQLPPSPYAMGYGSPTQQQMQVSPPALYGTLPGPATYTYTSVHGSQMQPAQQAYALPAAVQYTQPVSTVQAQQGYYVMMPQQPQVISTYQPNPYAAPSIEVAPVNVVSQAPTSHYVYGAPSQQPILSPQSSTSSLPPYSFQTSGPADMTRGSCGPVSVEVASVSGIASTAPKLKGDQFMKNKSNPYIDPRSVGEFVPKN